MCGSTFKIKVKAIRYLTYEEVKTMTYQELKVRKYNDLKGE